MRQRPDTRQLQSSASHPSLCLLISAPVPSSSSELPAMRQRLPLEGVIALVVARSSDAIDYRRVLQARLASLGAAVVARFGRDVTHIVFRSGVSTSSHISVPFERTAKCVQVPAANCVLCLS